MAADREDSVYQAKLAEQAERYDGKNFFTKTLLIQYPPKPDTISSSNHVSHSNGIEGCILAVISILHG